MTPRHRHGATALAAALLLAASAAVAAPEGPKGGTRPIGLATPEAGAGPVTASALAGSQAVAARAGIEAVEPARACPRIKVVYAGYGEAERAGCSAGSVSAAR